MVNSATPSLFRRLFVEAFLPATLLITAGCGGGDEPASDSAASAAPAEADASASGGAGAAMGMAPPDPAAMSGGAAMPGPGGMSGMPGMMPPAGSESSGGMAAGYPGGAEGAASMTPGAGYPGAAGTAQAQVPARPADVATWTDAQFVDAVHERDPKLLAAIDSRVKSSPGDPKVAEMLTSLLAALANPRTAATTQQNGAAGYPEYGSDPAAAGAASGAASSYPGYPGGGVPAGAAPAMAAPAGAYPTPGAMPADSSSSSSSSSSSGSPATGSGRAPIPSAPPSQSSIERIKHGGLAIDSISLMVLESSTAYFQSPAVGAVAGRSIPGAVGAVGPGNPPAGSANSGGGSSAGISMPPGAMPAGAAPGAMLGGAMPAGAAGAPMTYPGADYAGGSYAGDAVGIPGSAGAANGGLSESQLIERIVEGLIQNGSPGAWQTIYGIASQTVKTPLPPGAGAEIVTQALYRNLERNPAMIEPILVSLIDGSAQLPPESRSVALRVTAQISGLAADKLTGFQTLAALPTTGGQMGMAGMPGGGAAMGMSGQAMSSYPGAAGMPAGASSGAAFPGGAEAAADGYTGVGGAAVPGAGMPGVGMPGVGLAGGSAGAAALSAPMMSDAALMRAASFLWGQKCVDALVKQLDASSDIGLVQGFVGGGDFVRIAATVPNDRVRKALATLFEKTAPASVGQLGMTGFFSSSVHDPGTLIAMKSLPRTKPSRTEAAQGAPMDAWSTANLDVVLSLRDRMRALSAIPGKLTPVTENLPIRLHKNAVPEFYGVLTLPGPAASALKESAPSATKVYYARTSFTPEKPKDQQDLADHYESRATGIKRASEAKGVLLWVDGFKATQTGSKRTADVIIQSSTGGGGGAAGGYGESGAPGVPPGYGSQPGAAGGGGGAFSIEIIIVETAEPKAVADANASAAAKK